MFSEWPVIEPERDSRLLREAELTLVEFLRSLYIKGTKDPLHPEAEGITLICRN